MSDCTDRVGFTEAEVEYDQVHVKVLFGATGESDLRGKILRINGQKVLSSRLGSWLFHAVKEQKDVEKLLSEGGAIVAFIWALFNRYPEITAWVSDVQTCRFLFDVEKSKKLELIKEIGEGKMQRVVQEFLSSETSPDSCRNLRIKLIRILPNAGKPESKAPNGVLNGLPPTASQKPSTSQSRNDEGPSQTAALQPTSGEEWKLLRSRRALSRQSTDSDRLPLMLDIASIEFSRNNLEAAKLATQQAIQLLGKITLDAPSARRIFEAVSNLSSMYRASSDYVTSINLLLSTATTVKTIKDRKERVRKINDDVIKIRDSLTQIYSVKQDCLIVLIGEKDEIRPKNKRKKKKATPETRYGKAKEEEDKGRSCLACKDFSAALRHFDQALQLQPRHPSFHLDKAEVYFAQKDFDKCTTECNTALKLGKEGSWGGDIMARAYKQRGETELQLCRPRFAIEDFQASLKLRYDSEVSKKLTELEKDKASVPREVVVINPLAALMGAAMPPFMNPLAALPGLDEDLLSQQSYDDQTDDDDIF